MLDLSPSKKQQLVGRHAQDASNDRRQNLHPDEIAGSAVKVKASVSTHNQLKKREVVKEQHPKAKNSDHETESQAKSHCQLYVQEQTNIKKLNHS